MCGTDSSVPPSPQRAPRPRAILKTVILSVASDSGLHSGLKSEKPVAEAVADHQGPRPEGRGQPPAKVSVPPARLDE